MKTLSTWLVLIAVTSLVSCDKYGRGNGSWTVINKSNVEQCFQTQLGGIDNANSFFDLDDAGPDLTFQIRDFSGTVVGFQSDYFYAEDAQFASWMEFESDSSGIMISLDLDYQSGFGNVVVHCDLPGSRLEIGRAEFISRL